MRATFDPARNLDLYFRKGRDGSKTFRFLNADGTPYDFDGQEFRFISGYTVALSFEDNDMLADITAADSAVKRDSYYWELYNVTTKRTWLCGTSYFTSALSAQADDTVEEITINLDGETVEVTIQTGAGSGGGSSYKGPFDASAGSYPTDPEILDGDYYRVSVGGVLDVAGIGDTLVFPGALLFALSDDPGDTATNWKVIQ